MSNPPGDLAAAAGSSLAVATAAVATSSRVGRELFMG